MLLSALVVCTGRDAQDRTALSSHTVRRQQAVSGSTEGASAADPIKKTAKV